MILYPDCSIWDTSQQQKNKLSWFSELTLILMLQVHCTLIQLYHEKDVATILSRSEDSGGNSLNEVIDSSRPQGQLPWRDQELLHKAMCRCATVCLYWDRLQQDFCSLSTYWVSLPTRLTGEAAAGAFCICTELVCIQKQGALDQQIPKYEIFRVRTFDTTFGCT